MPGHPSISPQVDYFNNKTVCDLIEGRRPAGVLAFLDEETLMPKGTDQTLYTKMAAALTPHAHFSIPVAHPSACPN